MPRRIHKYNYAIINY